MTTYDATIGNVPVPNLSYFSPQHQTSPGTAKTIDESTPTIFRPLKVRGVTLRNRICVSPMCQYSCAPSGPSTGVLTPHHIVTLGHYAYKGAALVMVEATGVQPNGRISVNCPGLYNDAQQTGLKSVAEVIHSHGALIGVQLSHGGRKSGTTAPWIANRQGKGSARASVAEGGWPDNVVGPMGGAGSSWDGKPPNDESGGFCEPKQMTRDDIKEFIADWASSANRAVMAGVDIIEIHAAHGYLLHQFLSPITNQRSDEYGGSFENRIRLTIEVIAAVRAAIPETMPIILRKTLGQWDVSSTTRLAKLLPSLGVDILDISSGGNHPAARLNVFNAGKEQAEIAKQLRKELRASDNKLLVSVVGMINESGQARDLVEQNSAGDAAADLIFVARKFLNDPAWVMRLAEDLGVDVAWPIQMARPQITGSKG
ncbi:NADPH dehydrogenase [Neohortaea acidophila]|uniref:NADPH dehydrogenase n=1 Tax=Neohortaea acidophila TaxID=245834 RepID=A0A6A6PNU3_9PEZI|nr:NADPH dehydrogenase [Neohortaea acidophila]KAF2481575.1 NADPH dehydrogenase [Neohortaea acidophila]